jgi:membrane protease YdiL (CAAX protease family)
MSTLAIGAKPSFVTALKQLLVRHPYWAFFTIAYAATWILNLPLLLSRDGFGLLPYSVPFVLYALLFLLSTYAGPTLAAFLITGALEGKAGIRRFLRRYGQWRVGIRWYLLIFIGFPLLNFVLASLLVGPIPVMQGFVAHWSTVFTVYLPAALIFPALINWGEEPGWRGFAQTRMQIEYGVLRTTLVVSLLHGVWHLPAYFLIGGPASMGPFDPWWFALNTLDIMMIAVIFTWIFNNAQCSILIAALSHATWNAADQWIGSLIPNNLVQQLGIWQIRDTQAVFLLVCALLIIFATKGRLGYSPTEQAQPTSVG